MVRLTASDFYTLLRPTRCENRVYLRHKGFPEAPLGPFDEILLRFGQQHEASHLATLPEVPDLREGTIEERAVRTKDAIQKKCQILYQPVLTCETRLGGKECKVVGEPDFMIRDQGSYLIRDSKISRRITEKDHPEILRQLEIYGWLYEQIFKQPPVTLQVHAGTGDIVSLPYGGGLTALKALKEIVDLKQASSEQYTPVGWTKCGGCPFYDHCWPRAERNRDVALVAGVDQSLALELNGQGVKTIDQLLERFDQDSLANLKRPWGKGTQRVRKRAESILRMARAMSTNKEYLIASPAIPDSPNYVMLDLEGLPPHLDEIEKIYLWGVRVFGERPGEYMPAVAGFGNEGDREGWEGFLLNSKDIFDRHGTIPFVHWHHYEKVRMDMYVDRYGDIDGIAARVRQNLLDLLPITRESIALPLSSYSLKVVEKYLGFKRSMDEYGGQWAMAKYIEAVEIQDAEQRDEVVNQILDYNREDLEATWAVLNWIKSKG
jgi:predicted RecB family nuclease